MTTFTPHHRRRVRKFPPEYSRGAFNAELMDDAVFDNSAGTGGGGGGASTAAAGGLQAWQLPRPKKLCGVIVCGQIKQRMCTVFYSRHSLAN